MKDNESSPPRSVEESLISVRLLSCLLKPGWARTVILVEIFATKEWEILGEVLVVATSPVSIGGRNRGDPPKYCCR